MTATLDSGTGPLQGTTNVTVSGGVATFTNLADNRVETITLKFTSGSLTSATSNASSSARRRPVGDLHPAVVDGDGRTGVRDPAGHLRRGSVRQPGNG